MQIQLKSLAEEMQAVNKGLEKVEQELTTSENDGPVSEIFRKVTVTNLGDLGRIFPLVFV
jgi:DNA-binding protein YbaB